MTDRHPAARAAFRASPRALRLLFVVVALFSTLLIWLVYSFATNLVAEGAVRGLRERIDVDSHMLEDHVSRALDGAVGVLKVAAAADGRRLLQESDSAVESLGALIAEVPVVRSLSLVDSRGVIVASSSARNLGANVAKAALPLAATWSGVTEVKFGRAYPLRDLNEIGQPGMPKSVGFWTAAAAVEIDGRLYHWVAAINLGVFQNLWDQVDPLPATAINLMDEAGRVIIQHHPSTANFAAVARQVLDRMLLARQGSFLFGPQERYLVAYRGSPHYPVSMVMVGDRDLTLAGFERTRYRAMAIAALVNLLALSFVALLFGFYRKQESLARELANQSNAVDLHLMVSEYDVDGKLLRGNEAFFRFNGYQPEELAGAHYSILSGDLRGAELNEGLWEQLRDGQAWRGTLRNRRKSGEQYWVSATVVPFLDVWGHLKRVVALMTDISDSILLSERVEREQRLREDLSRLNRELATDAATDALTGLPNKRAFDAFMSRAIEVSRSANQPLAIILLDLDHFKQVNDVYGHLAGDVVLKEVGRRWLQEIRSSDMLARIGGEEFCVVLPRTPALHAERIAEKLRSATARSPIVVDLPGQELRLIQLTVSLGVATVETPVAATAERLLQAADEALYQAKRLGRDRVMAVLHG